MRLRNRLPMDISLTFRDGTKLVVPAFSDIRIHLGLFCEPVVAIEPDFDAAQKGHPGRVQIELGWGPGPKKITPVPRVNRA